MNDGIQKAILCYGDSNTWGFIPSDTMHTQRYSRNIRWTGLLQNLLGDNYHVIEEGLNGRTTNLDYKFPPDRNGESYLPPCLYSHAPLDLVILSLGGNDLKSYFSRSSMDICKGLSSLVEIIKSSKYGKGMIDVPEILIVSQPIPLLKAEEFRDDEGILVFKNAIERAKSLVKLYANLAKESQCYFLDISHEIKPSEIDGMHLDKNGHKKFAILIKNRIDKIFSQDYSLTINYAR